MSNLDFRQIARKGTADKAERLFRAAVSAYCCLSYPTRAEAQQLDDLALPLYPHVGPETLRYVSAALSECAAPPPALVARLVQETPDISAPLLIRTSALSDVDLIALIARKGIGHARIIARRKKLHPTIAALAAALLRKENTAAGEARKPLPAASPTPPRLVPGDLDAAARTQTAEEARKALRTMMLAPAQPRLTAADSWRRLRSAALSGSRGLLHAALAEVLRVGVDAARMLVESTDTTGLVSALRSLDLEDEQAFVLMACVFPNRFPHPVAIRLFFERYDALAVEAARETLRSLRADAPAPASPQPRRSAG
ncbi:MAG TPA: hypothetical protein VIU14_02945 [Mesorhizobium sp.]